ncbi:MAG TPA: C1 family peptidase, partial [Chitinophagaceae bacterium]|nr:C1 family peptidase [Chitinophagaceae bacterium]
MKKSFFLSLLIFFALLAKGQSIVDYRYCQSPVRNQGERGTCTAFAIAAVLENFNGVPANLSEQYLYACLQMGDYLDTNKTISPGGSLFGYSKSLQQYGVLHESRMPYNKKQLETP